MKIYSKKRFISGIISFIIMAGALITRIILISNRRMNGIRDVKNISILLIGLISAAWIVYTSLNEKENREADIEEKDERNKLISLHINNRVNKIMFSLYWMFMVLFILLWSINKKDLILIPVIVFGLLISINVICTIIASIYYERKL